MLVLLNAVLCLCRAGTAVPVQTLRAGGPCKGRGSDTTKCCQDKVFAYSVSVYSSSELKQVSKADCFVRGTQGNPAAHAGRCSVGAWSICTPKCHCSDSQAAGRLLN